MLYAACRVLQALDQHADLLFEVDAQGQMFTGDPESEKQNLQLSCLVHEGQHMGCDTALPRAEGLLWLQKTSCT